MKIGSDRNENKINDVAITSDTLSNRGGLSFIVRYLDKIGIISMIEDRFGHLRKSSKGESIGECARQVVAFCMDGTKHSMARFDELKTTRVIWNLLDVQNLWERCNSPVVK